MAIFNNCLASWVLTGQQFHFLRESPGISSAITAQRGLTCGAELTEPVLASSWDVSMCLWEASHPRSPSFLIKQAQLHSHHSCSCSPASQRDSDSSYHFLRPTLWVLYPLSSWISIWRGCSWFRLLWARQELLPSWCIFLALPTCRYSCLWFHSASAVWQCDAGSRKAKNILGVLRGVFGFF